MNILITTSPELTALQSGMAEALLGDAAAPAKIHDASRFAIHRNNVFVALTGALRATYPATRRLAGEDFFRAAATACAAACPPSSPVLAEYGESFPAFLQNFEPERQPPWLADVARLEWLRNEAFHAADASALSPEALAGVPAGRIGRLTFVFHPSARLLSSPYAVVSLWNAGEDAPVSPDAPGEAALIVRRGGALLTLRLDHPEYALACALMEGRCLLDAFAAAPPGLSFATGLARLLSAGAFSAFGFKD